MVVHFSFKALTRRAYSFAATRRSNVGRDSGGC